MKRRTFLRGALASAVGAGLGALWFLEGSRKPWRGPKLAVFSPAEAETLSAVAARLVTPLDAAALNVVQRADAFVAGADEETQRDLKRLLVLFDSAVAAWLLDGRARPFTELTPEGQDQVLVAWRDSRLSFRRSGFQALQRLCVSVAYADPSLYPACGYAGPPRLVRPDGSVVGED